MANQQDAVRHDAIRSLLAGLAVGLAIAVPARAQEAEAKPAENVAKAASPYGSLDLSNFKDGKIQDHEPLPVPVEPPKVEALRPVAPVRPEESAVPVIATQTPAGMQVPMTPEDGTVSAKQPNLAGASPAKVLPDVTPPDTHTIPSERVIEGPDGARQSSAPAFGTLAVAPPDGRSSGSLKDAAPPTAPTSSSVAIQEARPSTPERSGVDVAPSRDTVTPTPPKPSVLTEPAKPSLTPEETAEAGRLKALASSAVADGSYAVARAYLDTPLLSRDPDALYMLAQTYDTRMLTQWGAVGIAGDDERAERLYRESVRNGHEDTSASARNALKQ